MLHALGRLETAGFYTGSISATFVGVLYGDLLAVSQGGSFTISCEAP